MNEKDFAQGILRHLDRGTRELDSALVGRLHEARFAALSRVPVRELRLLPSAGASSSGFSSWEGPSALWRTTLVALMIAAAIAAFSLWKAQDQDADDDGQLDAKLLSSELPPQAFAQKDFGAWLQETR
ncbi:MAG: DUF3619 family protein [Betaproteobacteria bacterium]|nr:DUF3619 family protein [Betaproteobacteria bacterium]MDE2623149.1 DUF3619 family protein [Betaproteobacteria bacterium]